MMHWAQDAVFYHIYPLGLLGAEERNSFQGNPASRLRELFSWGEYFTELGVNALYLGPLFESSTHGYDTKDYYLADRRLGSNRDLRDVVAEFHRRGIRVVFDAVFNHVGRDFFAFQDLLRRGGASPYRTWFAGLRFDGKSPLGDPFGYEGWNGHYNLVKLDLTNPEVREHLFEAADMWIREFDIDGLRLDAADCLDLSFLAELRSFCKSRKKDFWLVGEVVAGDYRTWANAGILDSVTNYEAYKGLWSSHNDVNYFEIAYSLNRQFGREGLYRDLPLYNFVDNHDVHRAASILKQKRHLYPLYCLLFTMPGVPSLYYGSERGLLGEKGRDTDAPLRPRLTVESLRRAEGGADLYEAVRRLLRIRKGHAALRRGAYRRLHVNHEQLVFLRKTEEETLIVGVNAAEKAAVVDFPFEETAAGRLRDVLNGGEIEFRGNRVEIPLYPNWARVLYLSSSE